MGARVYRIAIKRAPTLILSQMTTPLSSSAGEGGGACHLFRHDRLGFFTEPSLGAIADALDVIAVQHINGDASDQ